MLRLGVQLTSLLVLLIPAAASLPALHVAGIGGALAVAGLTAAAACLANNLPASAAVAAALTGPAAYAALAGVSVGALGTEHGSVATLLAGDLAGARAYDRRIVPFVAAALAAATALLWVARPSIGTCPGREATRSIHARTFAYGPRSKPPSSATCV